MKALLHQKYIVSSTISSCYFVFVALTLVCAPLHAQVENQDALFSVEKETALVERLRRQVPFAAAVSIAVAKKDRSFSTSFGFADLRRKRKATKDTRYRMASVTKSFTAIAILQMVEKGKIRLDDEVQRYVPGFPKKRWPLTIRHLLGHLSGVSHYKNLPGERSITEPMTTSQSLALFENWPLLQTPGEKYVYTSYGFNLLGAVLEGASKKSYAQVLKRNIFKPLKMTSSSMDGGKIRLPHQPVGYKLDSRGNLYPSPFVDISSRFAGGGTRASVLDMVRFGKGVLKNKLVSEKTRSKMFTSMTTTDGHFTDYGMGFAVYPLGGRWLVAHAGAQPETSTLLLMIPDEDLVIAIASNVEDQWRVLQTLSRMLIAEVLDDGKMRRGLTADDASSQIQLSGLNKAFGHGLAHYTRFSTPLTTSPGELTRAFSKIRDELSLENIQANPIVAVENVKEGFHPAAHRAYSVVGAHMASVVEKHTSADELRTFHLKGPLAFMTAYEAACEDFDCPNAFSLGELNANVHAMYKAQQRAEEHYDPRFVLEPKSTLSDVTNALSGLAGKAVKPDFSSDLGKKAVALALEKSSDEAAGFDALNAKIFPHAAQRLWSSVRVGCLLDAPSTTRNYDEVDLSDAISNAFRELVSTPQAASLLSPGRIKFTALIFRRKGFPLASLLLLQLAADAFVDEIVLQDAACKEGLRRKGALVSKATCRRAQTLAPSKKRKTRVQQADALPIPSTESQ
ncbi:MAG: beta-lactamase family protein [Deltaproteobacteria bacterium]|nr:beta-lactamase family protein [Deltaproteobacteria bacterium]